MHLWTCFHNLIQCVPWHEPALHSTRFFHEFFISSYLQVIFLEFCHVIFTIFFLIYRWSTRHFNILEFCEGGPDFVRRRYLRRGRFDLWMVYRNLWTKRGKRRFPSGGCVCFALPKSTSRRHPGKLKINKFVFCFQNCFSDWEKEIKFEAEGREFAKRNCDH